MNMNAGYQTVKAYRIRASTTDKCKFLQANVTCDELLNLSQSSQQSRRSFLESQEEDQFINAATEDGSKTMLSYEC